MPVTERLHPHSLQGRGHRQPLGCGRAAVEASASPHCDCPPEAWVRLPGQGLSTRRSRKLICTPAGLSGHWEPSLTRDTGLKCTWKKVAPELGKWRLFPGEASFKKSCRFE